MDELIKWALTAQGLSVSGVLLAAIVFLLLSIGKRWWIPKWVYDGVCKERDDLRVAKDLRDAEDRDALSKANEKIDRMEQRIEDLTTPLIARQERKPRSRSSE